MKQFLLDVKATPWIKEDNHLLLIIIAAVSLLTLVGIFIYKRKKTIKN